jgi:hypothetical protein
MASTLRVVDNAIDSPPFAIDHQRDEFLYSA